MSDMMLPDEDDGPTKKAGPTEHELYLRKLEIGAAGNQMAVLLKRLEDNVEITKGNIYTILERMALVASKENMAAMSERVYKLEALATERLSTITGDLKEVTKTAVQAAADASALQRGQKEIRDTIDSKIRSVEDTLKERKQEAQTQVTGLKTDIDGQTRQLKDDLKEQTTAIKDDLKEQTTALKADAKTQSDILGKDVKDLGQDIKELRDALRDLKVDVGKVGGHNAAYLLGVILAVITMIVGAVTLTLRFAPAISGQHGLLEFGHSVFALALPAIQFLT